MTQALFNRSYGSKLRGDEGYSNEQTVCMYAGVIPKLPISIFGSRVIAGHCRDWKCIYQSSIGSNPLKACELKAHPLRTC